MEESENAIRHTVSVTRFPLSRSLADCFGCFVRDRSIGRCLRFTFVVKGEMWIIGSRAVNETQGRFRGRIQMLNVHRSFLRRGVQKKLRAGDVEILKQTGSDLVNDPLYRFIALLHRPLGKRNGELASVT